MAKMTMKKWEKSKADKSADKAAAKKKGIPMAKWEGSKADERMDKAALKKANKKK